jgi:hypothetical protein
MDAVQLGRELRRRRIAERPREQEAADTAAFADRHGGYIERPDGGARYVLDLTTAADYELHRAAHQAYMTQDPDDTPEDQKRSWGQRLYDASMEIARRVLRYEDTPTRAGAPVTASIVIPVETLQAAEGEPSPAAELGFAGPISAATARQLLCDAHISTVLTKGGSEILNVGRADRFANAAQYRALMAVWHGCARCGAPPGFCVLHHILWWERDEGPTDLDNLLPLCWSCHTAVHHSGLEIEPQPDGSMVFVSRRGSRQHRAPPTPRPPP